MSQMNALVLADWLEDQGNPAAQLIREGKQPPEGFELSKYLRTYTCPGCKLEAPVYFQWMFILNDRVWCIHCEHIAGGDL